MMRSLWIGLLLLLQLSLMAQTERKTTSVVFYNVENLFDTRVSKGKSDFEFSPGSVKKWDQKKYAKKLYDISRVLTAADRGNSPSLIGLCEVENRQVLVDLAAQKALAWANYSIVHHESRDRRGIDVALLYRSTLFREISSRKIPVGENAKAQGSSREMLYVKLFSAPADTIHVFVCHWHSRSEGEQKTEPKRILAARTLRAQVDSLFRRNKNTKILIMGDLNDEPVNASVKVGLQARQPGRNNISGQLYNLVYDSDLKSEGTVGYRGKLLMFDQLIVSGALLNGKKGWSVAPASAKVFRTSWMEYRNKNGQISPNRTYTGNHYAGGISDHFPVILILQRN